MQMGWLVFLALACVTAAIIFSVRRTRRADAPASVPVKPWVATTEPTPSAASADEQARIMAEIFEQLHKLAFGVNTLKRHTVHGHEEVISAVDAALVNTTGDFRHMPRRPMLLPQLLRAVNDTEGARSEISDIIGQDPALAGSLLKLANSPLYRVGSQPVESVDRAIAVLGTDGIRSLISAALLQPVFRVKGDIFRGFPDATWEHTFLAGGAAESFASGAEEDPFTAQLLAMLMGLGAIIVFRAALDSYEAAPENPFPDAAIVATLIDKHCAPIARRIAENWGLSERIFVALDEQESRQALHELSPLGQYLRLGRLAGALAILKQNDLVTDKEVRTALAQSGASLRQFERVWNRLSQAQAA